MTMNQAQNRREVLARWRWAVPVVSTAVLYTIAYFTCWAAFGIKIEKGEMFSPELVNDPNFVQGGNITPRGITELKTRMPYANVALLEADPQLDNMAKLFTVDMITNFVQAKLAAKGE